MVRSYAAAMIDEPVRVRPMHLVFGRFGALPVLEVAFDGRDVYVLVDGLTGAMTAAAVTGTVFDGTSLLTKTGGYVSGSGAEFVDLEGCVILAATRVPWTPLPAPATPGAPLPGTWTPPTYPFPMPGIGTGPAGRPSPWTCNATTSGPCICTTTYNYVDPSCCCGNTSTVPGGCLLKIEIVCNGGQIIGSCPATSPNTTPGTPGTPPTPGPPPTPGTPPTIPSPTPPSGAAGTCVANLWIWN
jgi:hypothetical protein